MNHGLWEVILILSPDADKLGIESSFSDVISLHYV